MAYAGDEATPKAPAYANGMVYTGAVGEWCFSAFGASGCVGLTYLAAFDGGGNFRWRTADMTPIFNAGGGTLGSSQAVVNGVVYIGSVDQSGYPTTTVGRIDAFDANGNTNCSGTPKMCDPLWTASTGGGIHSAPAVANGVVYVGSDDGKLYAFDTGGNLLWTARIAAGGGFMYSSPAVANGVVYVGLYAFDATGNTNCSGTPKTCTPLWTGGTGGNIASSPAVSNGMVYVVSTDGKLHAFGLP